MAKFEVVEYTDVTETRDTVVEAESAEQAKQIAVAADEWELGETLLVEGFPKRFTVEQL